MLNKLLSLVREYRMIEPGDRVICAVSGGADSVAMLFALYLLREKLDITLEAAHFNHRLRPGEADRDQKFVSDLCHRLDIRLHMGSEEVVPGEKGLEAAARDARYCFLDSLDGKIATAHTADDNAETVLMHLVRGTGLKGLGGISPVRGKLIRPMLAVTRQNVLDFLEEYNLSWVEDSSNDTDAFLRNRLRHHVMPLLRQENPRLGENLSAMALRLRQDELLLNPSGDVQRELEIEQVKALPEALRNRTIAAFLKQCGVKEPDSGHIAQTTALLYSTNPSARIPLPGGIAVGRQYEKLVRLEKQQPFHPEELPIPGTVLLPELGLRVSCSYAAERINTKDVFTVAAEAPIVIRQRQPGDTIRLPGGTKSLKKLFIDRKIPAADRERIPVLADARGVLGVWEIGVNRDRIAEELPAVQIRFENIHSDK